MTEYIENATLHKISLPSAGNDSRMKSCNSTPPFSNIARSRIFTSFETADTQKQSTSCTAREIEVASATPRIPSFGAPNHPYTNTAFRKILSMSAVTFNAVLVLTRSMLRSTAR